MIEIQKDKIKIPIEWLNAVVNEENVNDTVSWGINKEKYIDDAPKFYYEYYKGTAEKIQWDGGKLPDKSCVYIIMPSGLVRPMLRLLCEIKVLPAGVRDTAFYDFNNKIPLPERIVAEPRGARMKISYDDIKAEPTSDLVIKTNKLFSHASLSGENEEILYTAEQHAKHKLLYDEGLSIHAVKKAIDKIRWEGLDIASLVLCVHLSGYANLINDPYFKKEWELKFGEDSKPPVIITNDALQKLLDITIIPTSSCPSHEYKTKTIWQKLTMRSTQEEISSAILFIPYVTFGLVTSEDMALRSGRRHEFKEVMITGKSRYSIIVKNPESLAVIYHKIN